MKKAKNDIHYTQSFDLIHSKPATITLSVLAICAGLFFALYLPNSNKPVTREEAAAYSGHFERYESGKNYCTIYFEDGECYDVYPHTESREFRDTMESLSKGTKLHLLINPNNGYVAEIKTDTRELLDFETSQTDVDAYDDGYMVIGIIACFCGVFLIFYTIGSTQYKKKEDARHKEKRANAGSSTILRNSDPDIKCRVLLETQVQGYKIVYRRVRSVNELVVNGLVYDEKKGIIEFAHRLTANVGSHIIEAGLDENSFSYILFDGTEIKRKKRLV